MIATGLTNCPIGRSSEFTILEDCLSPQNCAHDAAAQVFGQGRGCGDADNAAIPRLPFPRVRIDQREIGVWPISKPPFSGMRKRCGHARTR